jgi:hypothetical protein
VTIATARDHGVRMAAILEYGFGNVLETVTRREARSDAVTALPEVAWARLIADQRGQAQCATSRS